MQTAYSSGPPDLVIAGLTVIDPIVAIIIGLTVLGEAANAPLWAYIGFGVAGVIAVIGVCDLARNHPQVVSDSQELPIQRGSEPVDADRGQDRVDADHGGRLEGVARAPAPRRRSAGRSLRRAVQSETSMTIRPSSTRPLSPGVGAGAGIST